MSEEPTRAMPAAEPPAAPPQEPSTTETADTEQVQSIDQTSTQRKFLMIGGIGCIVLLCICVGLGAALFFVADTDDETVALSTPEQTPEATVEPTPTAEATVTPEATETPVAEPTPTGEPEPTATPAPTPTAEPEATPTTAPEPTPDPGPSRPDIAFGDGTFIIGEDIAPGLYFANNPTNLCYWERLSGFSGDLDDIISNGLGEDRQIVAIAAGDIGFSSRDCGDWVRDDYPVREDPSADLVDGMFLVGDEVQPGTWRSEGSEESCYWARLSGFSGELSDIITNNFGGVGEIVEIQPGDAGFESSRCAPWVRIGD